MSQPQVTFHPLAGADPWCQEQVRLAGKPIGYLLYRHIPHIPGMPYGGGWAQYLVSDQSHRPIGEYRCSYLYRSVAVDALIAHATGTSVVAA